MIRWGEIAIILFLVCAAGVTCVSVAPAVHRLLGGVSMAGLIACAGFLVLGFLIGVVVALAVEWRVVHGG